MDQYNPVPVDAARKVAAEFHKDIVVIVSWDATFGQLHTTTYGVSPMDKLSAAVLGERLAAAAGGDMTKTRSFEDFRDRTQAEAAATIERLTSERAELIEVGEKAATWLNTLSFSGLNVDEQDEISEIAEQLEAVLRKLGWEPARPIAGAIGPDRVGDTLLPGPGRDGH